MCSPSGFLLREATPMRLPLARLLPGALKTPVAEIRASFQVVRGFVRDVVNGAAGCIQTKESTLGTFENLKSLQLQSSFAS